MRRSAFRMTKWFNSIDVDQFLGSVKAILGSLLEKYTPAEIMDKLRSSILATVFRQLVIHSFLCLQLPSCTIIKSKVSCGPGRWFYSWSCALWTSLTACCLRASPLWSSCSKAYPVIQETSSLRSVYSDSGPLHARIFQTCHPPVWYEPEACKRSVLGWGDMGHQLPWSHTTCAFSGLFQSITTDRSTGKDPINRLGTPVLEDLVWSFPHYTVYLYAA